MCRFLRFNCTSGRPVADFRGIISWCHQTSSSWWWADMAPKCCAITLGGAKLGAKLRKKLIWTVKQLIFFKRFKNLCDKWEFIYSKIIFDISLWSNSIAKQLNCRAFSAHGANCLTGRQKCFPTLQGRWDLELAVHPMVQSRQHRERKERFKGVQLGIEQVIGIEYEIGHHRVPSAEEDRLDVLLTDTDIVWFQDLWNHSNSKSDRKVEGYVLINYLSKNFQNLKVFQMLKVFDYPATFRSKFWKSLIIPLFSDRI